MTNEERDLIAKFVARVGGAPQSGGFTSSSVPATQPALPPVDREADQFIAQQFQMYPDARYRITQTAFVQEAALAEAANRIQQLQWELEQAKQALQHAPQAQKPGLFGSLFGGGSQPPPPPMRPQGPMQGPGNPWGQAGQQGGPQMGQPGGYGYGGPPPQPQYPPSYQPGMFRQGGSGFLGSALTTAAGVAGGMVVGNALMNAFSGHHGGSTTSNWGSDTSSPGSLFDGSGVNPTDPTAGFANNAGYSDPFAGGGDAKDAGGFDQQAGWDGGSSGGGFDNSGGGGFDSGGGGFDSGGGGFDSGGGSGGFDDNT